MARVTRLREAVGHAIISFGVFVAGPVDYADEEYGGYSGDLAPSRTRDDCARGGSDDEALEQLAKAMRPEGCTCPPVVVAGNYHLITCPYLTQEFYPGAGH